MGERHIGVEKVSGLDQTDCKLANSGGAAVCCVAEMCHEIWPWTLYNVVDVGVWICQSLSGGIMRTLAGQVCYCKNA